MARGTQLTQLVSDLRAEIGDSTSVSVGADFEATLKAMLRRSQKILYDEYDWPHMRVFKTKALVAGSRYYDFPEDMDLERVEEVKVKWNGSWYPVDRGVSFDEYNAYSPDDDERADPVQRWDIQNTGTPQIEVWPIPASAQTLYIRGCKSLSALVSGSDTADLDDVLLVLDCAAELLARRKSQDAGIKLQKRNERLSQLKLRQAGGRGPIPLAGGGEGRRSGHTIIRIA